jgi:hydroxylamine reductase
MFCFQCQETARGSGCEYGGVCGKTEDLAQLMDLLIYTMRGIGAIVEASNLNPGEILEVNREVCRGLFMTITNANFDEASMEDEIRKMMLLRDHLRGGLKESDRSELPDAAVFQVESLEEMQFKASYVGVLSTRDVNIRSLRQLITYGLKGMAAYIHHASNLGKEDPELYGFIYEALAAGLKEELTLEDLVALTIKTGEFGVRAMALLDEANTSAFGHPEITEVDLGVRNNPGILVSGHDLSDLLQLLEQTEGTGIDIYTHSEMLPAHYYPAFKKYSHFAGNYGSAWWRQLTDFEYFNGPILFTTNCIVPPESEEVRSRIFTTGASGYPGCFHIESDEEGKKDFSPVIEMAKRLPPPIELETGHIVGGFAHDQVFRLAEPILEAIRTGAVKQFVVMAGCDGRSKASEYFSVNNEEKEEYDESTREYYTAYAKRLPSDTVILTAGCAKYRYNKLNLGSIGSIPRVLDAGQCNDSYSLALIALKLKELLGLSDINDLPIIYNIAWYEQKAVIVLLALLSLGVKNIHLGPTLPAFLSPDVRKLLKETFGLTGEKPEEL